jgi:ABC-type branched-subunit amino acid transport system substrate-binding protein
MHRRRRLSWAVIGTAVGLLIAACGGSSSGGGTTTGDGGSAGSAVRGVTATSITVGSLVNAKSFAGAAEGAQARFDRANRDGGIDGRTIKFLGHSDDGGDPTTDQTLTRKLIDSDKAFAVVPVVSDNFLPQSSDQLVQAQVPYVGWGFMPGFCGPTWGFGFNGCLSSPTYLNSSLLDAATAAVNRTPADTSYAFQGEDDTAAKAGVAGVTAIVNSRHEGKIVYSKSNVPAGGGVTDWTPYVQPIIAANPDIVMEFMDFASEVAFNAAIHAAGYKGTVVNFDTYVPGLLQSQKSMADALAGVTVTTQIPPVEGGSPVITQIENDLKAAGLPTTLSLGELVGWFSADEFVQMLQAVGPNLTPTTFNDVINGKGWTYKPLDGDLGPVTFPADHNKPQPCSAVVTVENGQYKQLAAMKCFEVVSATG